VDVDLSDVPGPYTVLVRGLDLNGVTKKEKLLRDKWARVTGAVIYVPLRVEECVPQFILYDPNSTDPDRQNPVLEFDVVTHPNTAPVDVEIFVYDAVTHDQVGYRLYEDVNIGLTAPGNHHIHAWNAIFAGQTLPPKGVYVYNVVAYKR
jgi:hypothetical protein